MKPYLLAIVYWFARKLRLVAASLEDLGRFEVTRSKFINLAPTEEADQSGVYSEAINFAIRDPKIRNIALTGPYGSGKSSIIQSFVKRNQPRFLHISLAAFSPTEDTVSKDVTRQEIERSILQQMLYGADANRLPMSRFKRIQSPSVWSIFTSLYIVLSVAALLYVFHHRAQVFDGSFFNPFALSNWENLGIFSIAFVFSWTALHHLYVASFGVSLKSVSLKDIEIRPAAYDQESILNRHLDEIIYFFQSTKYDLVIIEDIDRFNDPEIFTTLRELNSLVNENAGVKRAIRFLYALRDDMFANTDRTKFFDFIIPVIPIINSSNSIDMVLEQGKRLSLDERLDRQFLREVSRHLNDLRLIQNIFNEYAIYVSNLETDEENLLDANKLLAVLIYKNVNPKDFESLHRGQGKFAHILKHQDELIKSGETTYRNSIGQLEQEIKVAERQVPQDIRELRQVYAMGLIEKLPAGIISLGTEGQKPLSIPQLSESEDFENLIGSQHLSGLDQHNQYIQINLPSNHEPPKFQESFLKRKSEIEQKSAAIRARILQEISELRAEIATLRTTKLNVLLRMNKDSVSPLFEQFGENSELARFLILEGYLDDTYYQYTSLFHSGRLSMNDNKFLIQIRAFFTPEPDFPLDNPREVIAAMRDEDFGQSYILNIKLVDCLLSDEARYSEQLQKFNELLSSNFTDCEEFLDVYYASGSHSPVLLERLARTWAELVPSALASTNNTRHISVLVAGLPRDTLAKLARDFPQLPDYVANNLPEILALFPEIEPNRLLDLNFNVRELSAIEEHSAAMHSMWDNGLFELTVDNFEYAFTSILGEKNIQDLRERNFTTLRALSNPILLDRAERDFERYLLDIVLALPGNHKEDEAAIVDVLCREGIESEVICQFIETQDLRLSSLGDVPESLHAMLFKLNAVEPTWTNCIEFMERVSFDPEILIEYFERGDVRSSILKVAIPDSSNAKDLQLFLVNASALSDAAYSEYARALPLQFKFVPEEVGAAKINHLIWERKLVFSSENFSALSEHRDLQVLFVATNIEAYLEEPDAFSLDDEFRTLLLNSEIDQSAKREVVKLMDMSALVETPERAKLVAPIIDGADVNQFQLSSAVLQALVQSSDHIATQISLLNKYHDLLTVEEARLILAYLPRPYSEIKTGYAIPRLENRPENINLVKWLDTRGIISSWSEGGVFSNDIRVNLYRQ